jgi:hypothetical protein
MAAHLHIDIDAAARWVPGALAELARNAVMIR